MGIPLEELAPVLFDTLRRMDAEAVTVRDGYSTGLNWFAGHARPKQKRPRTEPAWSCELAKRLEARGCAARCERPYPPPHGRQRCDLVVACEDAPRTWLEVKGAWKHYWSVVGSPAIYRSYLAHPLVPGLVAKTHSAAHDIAKLDRLTSADAEAAALLLIGFDHEDDPMAPDVAELESLSGLATAPWSRGHKTWPDARRAGQHVHAWLWWRRLG